MGPWHLARVTSIHRETASALTLTLSTPGTHLPGQHVVLRLTAPDGYTAQRSYSVASAPGGDTIDLTVELLPDGEVSSFVHEVVEVGDELEVRGPIGGFFAWDGTSRVLAVGGGSGVVPLMSMLRHARAVGDPSLVRLVVSVRRPEDLYYAGEIEGRWTTVAHTRVAPPDSPRAAGRLVASDLADAVDGVDVVFVCGTPGFCDTVTGLLAGLGVPASIVRTERFGPSG